MPIPKPKKNEEKNEFISRCISTLSDMKEFKDNDQRIAVCFSQWERKDEKISIIDKIDDYLNEKQTSLTIINDIKDAIYDGDIEKSYELLYKCSLNDKQKEEFRLYYVAISRCKHNLSNAEYVDGRIGEDI